MQASNQIKITKIVTAHSKAKKYTEFNGRLVKVNSDTGVITKAKAETIHINSLEDLKVIIDNSTPNEMLILGHLKHDIKNYNLATRNTESIKHNAYARTLENFVYDKSAIVLLDFDNLHEDSMTIEEAIAKFSDYYPSFDKAQKLICKSSSGAIKGLAQEKYHIFVIIEDASHASRVFKQWERFSEANNLPVMLDPALFASQQNRIVFLKPEVPAGYIVDKECRIIEGEFYWNPSEELEEEVLPELLTPSVTVVPSVKEDDLRNNNHSLLIERFDLSIGFDEIRELCIQVGCRPSNKLANLFTPNQMGRDPKLKIIHNGSHWFVSAIGKQLHGKRGYNGFSLLVKSLELQGKTKADAYKDAIRIVFSKIGGNDKAENETYSNIEKINTPKVISESDEKFTDIDGFEEAQKVIQKSISTYLKSVHGSGKTDHIVKGVLVNMIKDSDKKMVYIAPTVSLCDQAAFEINKTGVDVQVYSDYEQRRVKFGGAQIVITTPNSFVEKVVNAGFKPDIVVVDEWVRVAASLCQRDTNDPFMGITQRIAIVNYLKATKHLVLLDADDSHVATELANYLGVKSFMNNTHKEFTQPKYVIRDCKNLASLFDLAISYKNAFIFTDSRAASEELSVGLRTKNLKVLTVNTDTTGKDEVATFLANPNEEASKYDYVVYSPSMNVGTSVTSVEWPTIGLISGVVSPYDVLQGLRRCRRIGVVEGVEQPIHVFFKETRYNSDSKSGALTLKNIEFYNEKMSVMARTLFKSSDDPSNVIMFLEDYSSLFNIIYRQTPSKEFIKLLKSRGEKFDVISPDDETKDSVSGLTKSVVKKLFIEKRAEELANARPSLPSNVYHNFSARKALEQETGVEIPVDDKFVAEKTKDTMEMLLNLDEGFLDSVDNVKLALEENWLNKAIAYDCLVNSHPELHEKLTALGDGSKKTGEFAKLGIALLKEYCWNEGGSFSHIPMAKRMEIRLLVSGNYLSSFGHEFGVRSGKANKTDFEKASGQVIRRFLGNLGLCVAIKKKRVGGAQIDYSSLETRPYIRAKVNSEPVEISSHISEQAAKLREIIKNLKKDC